jgi:hypothetical protein
MRNTQTPNANKQKAKLTAEVQQIFHFLFNSTEKAGDCVNMDCRFCHTMICEIHFITTIDF